VGPRGGIAHGTGERDHERPTGRRALRAPAGHRPR
jgi:hypothetical protein